MLKITGPDASKFLQGQLTCDVTQLTEGKTQLAAHCNRQGRIISLFYIMLFEEAYLLMMPQALLSIAENALKKYAIFYKVKLEIISESKNKIESDPDRLKSGIVMIYPETSEKFLPHELNLPQLNAVSFSKGCYTGQEIIARMHYRGKSKKKLVYVTFHRNTPPARGEQIEINKKAAELVDVVNLNENNYAALVLQNEEAI